jgi:hypothetical protein
MEKDGLMEKPAQVGVDIKLPDDFSQEELVRNIITAVGVVYENAAAAFNGRRRFLQKIDFRDGSVSLTLSPSMSIREIRKAIRETMAGIDA